MSKKSMPVFITTYTSDDSTDEDNFVDSKNATAIKPTESDQEDDQPLSKLIPSSKSVISSNTSKSEDPVDSESLPSDINNILPQLSDSDESTDSDDSLDSADLDDFSDLTEQFALLPLSDLMSSKEFTAIRNRRRKQERPASKSIFSAYVLHFLDIRDAVKIENPNLDFYNLMQIIQTKWDNLSNDKKLEYKRKSKSLTRDQILRIQIYKSQLTELCNSTIKQCCNPKCTNPIARDPRWNSQYCSPNCVSEHCRDVFASWRDRRRFGDLGAKSDQANFGFTNLKVSCDESQTSFSSIGSSEKISPVVSVTSHSTEPVLQRRPLFESLREAALGSTKMLNSSLSATDIPLTRC